jgi:hypothetical protein
MTSARGLKCADVIDAAHTQEEAGEHVHSELIMLPLFGTWSDQSGQLHRPGPFGFAELFASGLTLGGNGRTASHGWNRSWHLRAVGRGKLSQIVAIARFAIAARVSRAGVHDR